MKYRQSLSWWIALASMAVMLGCRVLSGPAASPDPVDDLVATSVAATIETGAIQGTPSALPDILPAATQTPLPGPTALATVPSAEQTVPPEGSSLVAAYIDLNRNLWVWRQGSAPSQLTTSGDVENVQVADDGSWIAYSRTTNFFDYSLWAIQPDGSSETVLMDQPDFQDLPRPPGAVSVVPFTFAWVPGTHILAFNTRPAFEGLGLMLNDDLWLVNADNGEPQQLLEPGEGGMFSFSPDGSQIAISTPDKISLVDVDGNNRRDGVLSFARVSTYSEYWFYPDPLWSPDSSYLRVVIPPAAAMENPDDPAQVWHIPADGSSASLVGSFHTMPLIYPVLSPDLSKVAYLNQVGEPADNRRELHIAEADASADELYLTEVSLMFAAWAPDSQRFAFTVGDNMRPYLGQVGVGPQPLTDIIGAADVRWLDAERFFFISRSGESVELRLGSVGEASELIASASGDAAPFLNFDFTH